MQMVSGHGVTVATLVKDQLVSLAIVAAAKAVPQLYRVKQTPMSQPAAKAAPGLLEETPQRRGTLKRMKERLSWPKTTQRSHAKTGAKKACSNNTNSDCAEHGTPNDIRTTA